MNARRWKIILGCILLDFVGVLMMIEGNVKGGTIEIYLLGVIIFVMSTKYIFYIFDNE